MFTTMFKDPEIIDALTVISLYHGLESDELVALVLPTVRGRLQDWASDLMQSHRRRQLHLRHLKKVNNSATRRERKPVTLQIHQERNRR